jgi:hypothetical protein
MAMDDALGGAAGGASKGAALGSIVPGVGTVAGGIIGGIGGFVKGIFSGKGADKKAAALAAYRAELERLQVPNISELVGQYQNYLAQSPEPPVYEEVMQEVKDSAAGITPDSKAVKAQQDALAFLQNKYREGGATLQDIAQANEIATRTAAQARGARQAIQQNAAARGIGGGGAELAQALEGQSAANQTAAQESMLRALASREDRMKAIGMAADAATKLRSQGVEEQMDKAKMRSATDQFNAALKQQVAGRNAAALRDVQDQRLQEKRLAESSRVSSLNKSVADRIAATSDVYELQKQKIDSKHGIAGKEADLAAGRLEGKGAGWQSALQGAGDFVAKYGEGIYDKISGESESKSSDKSSEDFALEEDEELTKKSNKLPFKYIV